MYIIIKKSFIFKIATIMGYLHNKHYPSPVGRQAFISQTKQIITIMTTKRIEEFYQFLRDNNCYLKFHAYFKFFNKDYNSIEEYLKDIDERNPISGVFTWRDTDEGVNYWGRLHNKWRENIKEKQLTIRIKYCLKGNTEISLDVATALESMGYVVTLVKVVE